MKTLYMLLTLVFLGSAQADGQSALVDHWTTEAECMRETSAPLYYPEILSRQALALNEVVRGHPTGGCFEMDLPDRLGGRGFVRIEAGRKFVYNRVTGKVLRLAECNNKVHSWTPFPRPRDGRDGINGTNGRDGRDGINGINGRDGRNYTPSPPASIKVPSTKFWCFQNVFKGGTCLAGALLAIAGGVELHDMLKPDDKSEPKKPDTTTDSVTPKPPGPGTTTDSVCTGIGVCTSSLRAMMQSAPTIAPRSHSGAMVTPSFNIPRKEFRVGIRIPISILQDRREYELK
ncbi:MAG: hypothetical protein KBC06_01795 [Candidatus Pacebacteria bacterium]|nr:hypothetical protein [Candidatus Paceibacterota bacterium]